MSAPVVLCDLDKSRAVIGGEDSPLSRSAFYQGVAEGRFPKPVKIGGASRWLLHELQACVAAMIAARDNKAVRK